MLRYEHIFEIILTKKLNNIKNQEEYFTKINQVEKDFQFKS